MSLLEALKTEERNPYCCKVMPWYESLTDTERKAFDEWLKAGKSRRGLHRAARATGLNCSKWTFDEHCRGHHHD